MFSISDKVVCIDASGLTPCYYSSLPREGQVYVVAGVAPAESIRPHKAGDLPCLHLVGIKGKVDPTDGGVYCFCASRFRLLADVQAANRSRQAQSKTVPMLGVAKPVRGKRKPAMKPRLVAGQPRLLRDFGVEIIPMEIVKDGITCKVREGGWYYFGRLCKRTDSLYPYRLADGKDWLDPNLTAQDIVWLKVSDDEMSAADSAVPCKMGEHNRQVWRQGADGKMRLAGNINDDGVLVPARGTAVKA